MQDEAIFPAMEYLKRLGFDRFDIISGGGIVKPLAEASQAPDSFLTKYWQFSAKTSVKTNGAEAIAVMAHHDCKGNFRNGSPVSEEVQKSHLWHARETLASFDLHVPIILLWGREDGTFETV